MVTLAFGEASLELVERPGSRQDPRTKHPLRTSVAGQRSAIHKPAAMIGFRAPAACTGQSLLSRAYPAVVSDTLAKWRKSRCASQRFLWRATMATLPTGNPGSGDRARTHSPRTGLDADVHLEESAHCCVRAARLCDCSHTALFVRSAGASGFSRFANTYHSSRRFSGRDSARDDSFRRRFEITCPGASDPTGGDSRTGPSQRHPAEPAPNRRPLAESVANRFTNDVSHRHSQST